MLKPFEDTDRLGWMAAIIYQDGRLFDLFLQELVQVLRNKGLQLAGVVQMNRVRNNSRHCDMLLEDLASGTTVMITENRGEASSGCRLNVSALLDAGQLIRQSLSPEMDLLLINKFGKMESEGGGLRDIIIQATMSGIPVLTGVSEKNLDAWKKFSCDEAHVLPAKLTDVADWVERRIHLP